MNEAEKLALQIFKTASDYHKLGLAHPDFEQYNWACNFSAARTNMLRYKGEMAYYAAQATQIKKRMKK